MFAPPIEHKKTLHSCFGRRLKLFIKCMFSHVKMLLPGPNFPIGLLNTRPILPHM